MNVSVCAQTISASVANAIEFLKDNDHQYFTGSSATIHFIRVIDRLFDLLNSRNPRSKGFKSPLRIADKALWFNVIDESIAYLGRLKNIDHIPLL